MSIDTQYRLGWEIQSPRIELCPYIQPERIIRRRLNLFGIGHYTSLWQST